MSDLLVAVIVLGIVGAIVLSIYCWVGCETDAALHAEAGDYRPSPARRPDGAVVPQKPTYLVVDPDREFEAPHDAVTETHR